MEIIQKNNNESRIKKILSSILLIPDNAYATPEDEEGLTAEAMANVSANNEEFNEKDAQGTGDWWASLGITTAALELVGIGSGFLVPALATLKGILKPLGLYYTRRLITGAPYGHMEKLSNLL